MSTATDISVDELQRIFDEEAPPCLRCGREAAWKASGHGCDEQLLYCHPCLVYLRVHEASGWHFTCRCGKISHSLGEMLGRVWRI